MFDGMNGWVKKGTRDRDSPAPNQRSLYCCCCPIFLYLHHLDMSSSFWGRLLRWHLSWILCFHLHSTFIFTFSKWRHWGPLNEVDFAIHSLTVSLSGSLYLPHTTCPPHTHTHKWYVSSTRALTVVLLTILSAYHPNSLSKGICQMRKWIKFSSTYCQTNQSSVLLWKNKTGIKKTTLKVCVKIEWFASVQQKLKLESKDMLMRLWMTLTPLSFCPWIGNDNSWPVFLMAMLGKEENVSTLALYPHIHMPTHTHTRTHIYLRQQYLHLETIDDNLTKRKNALGTLDSEKGILIVL